MKRCCSDDITSTNHTTTTTTTATTNTKPKYYIERIFTQLLQPSTLSTTTTSLSSTSITISNNSSNNNQSHSSSLLHISSPPIKYRNKITYTCVLQEQEQDLDHDHDHHHQQQKYGVDKNKSYTNDIDNINIKINNTNDILVNTNEMKNICNDAKIWKTIIPEYSILAEDYINDICHTTIQFWQSYMDCCIALNNNNNHNIDDNNIDNNTDCERNNISVQNDNHNNHNYNKVLLREIMVKGTRSTNSIIIRLTIQFDHMNNENNNNINNNKNNSSDNDDCTNMNDLHTDTSKIESQQLQEQCCHSMYRKWDSTTQLLFRHYIQQQYPNKTFCLCYNIMEHNTNIRPMKDPNTLYFIPASTSMQQQEQEHDQSLQYVIEVTPNQIEYQISPDTFSEVNHPVELLQWDQTKIYIEELLYHTYHCLRSGTTKTNEQLQNVDTKPILIVSGRDISSFALGFGTLTIPPYIYKSINMNHTDEIANDVDDDTKTATTYMFQHVIGIQHCPLVNYDAIQNVKRYEQQHQEKQKRNGTIIQSPPKFTIYHCSKATMVYSFQNELMKYSTNSNNNTASKIPVFGVMTGGRKGLDPSYIQFLNHPTSNMYGIVYNSCATKSLLRDMIGFIRNGSFILDSFRSYDFLPNTPYTASLTKLIRRPRTLIILIGPAGVGKSTLVQQLVKQHQSYSNINATSNTNNNNNSNILWWERDRIFTKLRNDGIGLAKTKTLVHANLLQVLRRKQRHDNNNNNLDIQNESLNNNNISDEDSAVIIIDSTNGNVDGRLLYVQEAQPDLVIYVNFQIQETDEEKVIEYLLDCTKDRLHDNIENHPSFPKSIHEQRMKHRNILQGIVYPTLQEMDQIKRINEPYVKRSVLISCDPRDIQCRSELPYRVYLEYTTSSEIRKALYCHESHNDCPS